MDLCEIRLIEAAWTLQCLPDPDLKFRSPYKCPLPEHILDYGSVKNHHTPSPKEISQYEEALNWLQIIPPVRERKFMFQAFLNQRGRKKYRIMWNKVRSKTGIGGSDYICRTLYSSWLQTISNRAI